MGKWSQLYTLPAGGPPALNEFNILIGNSDNVSEEIDVSSLGDISASIASGLKLKPNIDYLVPVGTIVSYNPGYYTNAINGGFTLSGPATNDAAGVNAYLPLTWRVCDGTALNDAESPIWNAAGRYLPKLDDSRFLLGSTASGSAAGNNNKTLSTGEIPNHNHDMFHDHAQASTQGVSANHVHSMAHNHASVVSANASVDHAHQFGGGGAFLGTSGGTGNFGNFGSGGSMRYANASSGQTQTHQHNVDLPSYSGNTDTISVDHSHAFNMPSYSGNTGFTGSGSSFSILPQYLSTIYIIRIK